MVKCSFLNTSMNIHIFKKDVQYCHLAKTLVNNFINKRCHCNITSGLSGLSGYWFYRIENPVFQSFQSSLLQDRIEKKSCVSIKTWRIFYAHVHWKVQVSYQGSLFLKVLFTSPSCLLLVPLFGVYYPRDYITKISRLRFNNNLTPHHFGIDLSPSPNYNSGYKDADINHFSYVVLCLPNIRTYIYIESKIFYHYRLKALKILVAEMKYLRRVKD